MKKASKEAIIVALVLVLSLGASAVILVRNPKGGSAGSEQTISQDVSFTGGETRWEIDESSILTEASPESIPSASVPEKDGALPDQAMLNMQAILQNPELPTGCESVALTIGLKSLGFDLKKTEIAKKYLYYSHNMAIGFVGLPYEADGMGVFPPGLVLTANRFLDSVKADYTAYDASGRSIEELLSFIAAGFPVMAWTTMYFEEPRITENSYEFGGREYQLYQNEHCLTIQGYNLEKGTLVLMDPLQGQIETDMESFAKIYDETGRNAVTIY